MENKQPNLLMKSIDGDDLPISSVRTAYYSEMALEVTQKRTCAMASHPQNIGGLRMTGIYKSMLETKTKTERQSFTEFYERVNLKCLRVALGITKDQTLAEDAVHNAFLKFISEKEKFSSLPYDKQESLITIIVKNKAIDILRKENKLTTYIVNESGEETLADDFDISVDYESAESYERLVSLIDTLPEIYRVVFEMKYIQDLSNGEIAKLLDVTKEVVAMRLNRAKKNLAEMIRKGSESYGH